MQITITLNPDQQETCQVIKKWFHNVDMFHFNYCGHWLEPVKYEQSQGWLAFDYRNSQDSRCDEAAIEAWQQEQKLPSNYYQLNEQNAELVLRKGIELFGIKFLDDCDGHSIDVAMQSVLLDEITYC